MTYSTCGFKDSEGVFHDTEKDAAIYSIASLLYNKKNKLEYPGMSYVPKIRLLKSDVIDFVRFIVDDSEALYYLNKVKDVN